MRKTLLTAVAFVTALAVAACQSESQGPVALENTGGLTGAMGEGQGAQFFDNPFSGFIHGDFEGGSCFAFVDPPTDDINDFIRENPDGSQTVHITDNPAFLIVTTADGNVWSGPGRMTINASLTGPGWSSSATGKVADAGGNTGTANCKFTRTKQGKTTVARIDVH